MAKRTKQRPRTFQLAGGALLLLSFMTQMFLFSRWDDRSNDLRQAVLERAVIDKGALLYELQYFAISNLHDAGIPIDELRVGKLRFAGMKIAESSMMPIAYHDAVSATEKADLIGDLFRQAGAIGSYADFMAFLGVINKVNGKFSVDLNAQRQRIDSQRETARWVYLGLYLLGSTMLLVGTWRGEST